MFKRTYLWKKILTIEHLFFHYDKMATLEDVNVEIFDAEFIYAIFGPNGGVKRHFSSS